MRYEDDAENFLATQLDWITGAAKKQQKLPPGACFWQQGSLIKGIPTGPSEPNCKFQVSTLSVEVIRVTQPKPTMENRTQELVISISSMMSILGSISRFLYIDVNIRTLLIYMGPEIRDTIHRVKIGCICRFVTQSFWRSLDLHPS